MKGDAYHFRIFDVMVIPEGDLAGLLKLPVRELSAWREEEHHGYFQGGEEVRRLAEGLGVQMVPERGTVLGKEIPQDPEGTRTWLGQYRESLAGINVMGKAEGVVIRTYDRRMIRKLRFEDYERTGK